MKEIANIEQVKKILEDHNMDIEDQWLFHRFWSKVDIKDIEKCWNWVAAISNRQYVQYGNFQLDRFTTVRAHRVAYELSKGAIPEGIQVQHICNNGICCNPNHLKLGNHEENMKHMTNSHRQYSKLTEDEVKEIIKIYEEQRLLYPKLKLWQITGPISEKFDVSDRHIQHIINGNRWSHLKGRS